MTPALRWPPSRALRLVVAGAALLSLAAIVWLVRHRHDSDVLPPAVVQQIETEKAGRPSIDSAVAQARYEADTSRAARIAADARAQHMQRAAELQGRRADSLAQEARHAATARDSAIMWHLAYAARTSERDSLLAVVARKDTALSLAAAESKVLRVGLDTANRGRLRADSVLDATVHAVHVAECRVPLTFGLVRCMSRTKAAAVGVAAGVGAKMTYDAIRDGRLSIPLPFHR